MNAPIVVEAGKAPIYDHFEEPVPAADKVRVTVSAAALSTVVKSRASGKHYSPSENLPFVVGIDGVGRLDDGHAFILCCRKRLSAACRNKQLPLRNASRCRMD